MYQAKLKVAIIEKFGHPRGQDKLAARMGVSKSVVSSIITGRINATDEERRVISNIMRTPVKRLFTDNGDRK